MSKVLTTVGEQRSLIDTIRVKDKGTGLVIIYLEETNSSGREN